MKGFVSVSLGLFAGRNGRYNDVAWEISSTCQGLTQFGYCEISDSSQLTYDQEIKMVRTQYLSFEI
jgi:hypothetical protein